MVDKELLEAIGQMMDAKLTAQRKEIMNDVKTLVDEKVTEAEQRIAKNTVTLMDTEFSKRFDLLAEGIQDIQEKLVPRSRVDELEDEVKLLKVLFRQMNEDLQKLKKAN